MANRQKGETAITVNGKPYVLVLGTNEMEALEGVMSTPDKERSFFEIFEMVNRSNVRAMRAFVWAALQRYHATEIATPEAAGKFIDEAGGLFAFSQQLIEMATAATPDPDDLKELGIVNPPPAQGAREKTRRVRRGTGARSTSTHAASA